MIVGWTARMGLVECGRTPEITLNVRGRRLEDRPGDPRLPSALVALRTPWHGGMIPPITTERLTKVDRRRISTAHHGAAVQFQDRHPGSLTSAITGRSEQHEPPSDALGGSAGLEPLGSHGVIADHYGRCELQ